MKVADVEKELQTIATASDEALDKLQTIVLACMSVDQSFLRGYEAASMADTIECLTAIKYRARNSLAEKSYANEKKDST